MMKERASALAYALFANNNTSDPAARVFTSSDLATNPNRAAAAQHVVASGDDVGELTRCAST